MTPLDLISPSRPEKNGEESLLPERCKYDHLDAHELPKRADRAEQIFESLVAVSAETGEAETQKIRVEEATGHRHTIKAQLPIADAKATLT